MAFSDSIWWTRKAKIQAEKRLLANAFKAQVILLWYSFSAVAASVYYLKFSTLDNDMSGTAWVVYSVLVLCMSGFINGLSFKQRAGLVKECYETLNDIYQRVKSFEKAEAAAEPVTSTIEELSAEYEQVLGVSENHLTIDYYVALCEACLTQTSSINCLSEEKNNGIDRSPTKFIWITVGWYITKRWLMMGLFYVLPVILFLLLENAACQ